MEFLKCSIAIVCIIFLIVILRVLNSVWFRPKKLEKILRQQGLNGNSYRLLHGDFKEMTLMNKEACSKPINLSDDVLPRILPFNHKTVEKYGKNSFTWLGSKPSILIMDPDLMKEILVKHYNYQKPKNNPLVELLAGGLAAYEEDKWAKHRKLINPAFQLEKLKHMLPAFCLTCMEMLSKWQEKASSNGSYELDVWPYLQTLTGDVISRTAFGSNYEEGRKIFELQSELTQHVLIALRMVYIPGWRFVPTKRNKRMKELAKEVEASIKSIVDKRIMAMKVGEAKSDDLLGILLESNLKEIKENGNKDFGMTIKEVIEECKLFYLAGQETTSVLLCWTMILLSKHREWQQHAREEVLQQFGFENPGYDELNRLKVVTMIFYEVLRLFPPVHTLNRRTTQEIKLGKLFVPPGVHFQLQIMLLHYDSEIWGDDAKEFKPERFSEGISKATSQGCVAYYPFGWGPRICVGQNFTMLEAKMALALILQRFSFELSPSYTHAPYSVLTIQPQYGANIILNKL